MTSFLKKCYGDAICSQCFSLILAGFLAKLSDTELAKMSLLQNMKKNKTPENI